MRRTLGLAAAGAVLGLGVVQAFLPLSAPRAAAVVSRGAAWVGGQRRPRCDQGKGGRLGMGCIGDACWQGVGRAGPPGAFDPRLGCALADGSKRTSAHHFLLPSSDPAGRLTIHHYTYTQNNTQARLAASYDDEAAAANPWVLREGVEAECESDVDQDGVSLARLQDFAADAAFLEEQVGAREGGWLVLMGWLRWDG